MNSDTCICCGGYVPEGELACWACRHPEKKEKAQGPQREPEPDRNEGNRKEKKEETPCH